MTYRINDLDVPEDNPFQYDSLDRRPVVEFLSELIGRLNGPFVMALDSPWGSGKTTLVRMLIADLQRKEFQCVYFNAWKVDYITDPLVALVSSIDRIDFGGEEAANNFRSRLKTVKKVTTLLAKRWVMAAIKASTLGALDLEKEYEAIASELTANTVADIVDAFNQEIELLKKFRAELEAAVKQLPNVGKKPNLVFFIDELDRCRPTFAIKLLERIKHLFDIQNIVFVLSIDKQQLEAITAAVYGSGINAPEYLRRFIDLEYGIPAVHPERYTEALIERFGLVPVFAKRKNQETVYDKENFVEFFTMLADAVGLSLRARERCITRLRVVMDQTPENHYLDPILVALLIVLRSNKPDLFSRVVSGEASAETVMEYLCSLPNGEKFRTGRAGIIIDAYLIAFDPNHDRCQKRMTQLCKEIKDGKLPEERRHASDLLGMIEKLTGGFRGEIRLVSVAKKIDLAAMVEPQ
ncbi:KAP family P-loop NTPase fold protein [Dentiradicibacter hellwigii]|uniref:P-loop NTPase fold protein n=1 Tax=Dentiradicibacter hellwigii TaxID=3149053 RepID=A0ABV4UEX2_9RHOO